MFHYKRKVLSRNQELFGIVGTTQKQDTASLPYIFGIMAA
jgi:hypothetical protein